MRRVDTRAAKIDLLDKSIIAVLQENARLTNAGIAAQVSSTEPTVRRRVKRLLEEGLIRIVAVASPFALGYQVVALLGIQLDQSKLVSIANDLILFPEVRFAGITAGNYDILAEVWFQNTDELVSFIAGRLKEIPGIERVESIQVLKLLKYAYDWGVQPSVRLSPMPGRISELTSPGR